MLEVWVGGLVGGWVSESVTLFSLWASEVAVSFDWARDGMGCVRRSVSCAETLVSLILGLTYTKIRSLICYYLRCCLKSNVIVIAPLNCWLMSSHPQDGHPLSPGWSPTIHRTLSQHLQIKDGHQLSPLRTPAVPRMLMLNHHPQDSHP